MMPGPVIAMNDRDHLAIAKLIVGWAVVKPNLDLASSCCVIDT